MAALYRDGAITVEAADAAHADTLERLGWQLVGAVAEPLPAKRKAAKREPVPVHPDIIGEDDPL